MEHYLKDQMMVLHGILYLVLTLMLFIQDGIIGNKLQILNINIGLLDLSIILFQDVN